MHMSLPGTELPIGQDMPNASSSHFNPQPTWGGVEIPQRSSAMLEHESYRAVKRRDFRTIFKGAFAAAGLSYFNPHSFRKTLALFGGQSASHQRSTRHGPNLGPENVLTTFSSYGDVAGHLQAEIIRALREAGQAAGL
jgi:hypothetical protein